MLSPLRSDTAEQDPLHLPRKFVDGIAEFAAQWHGTVELVVPTVAQPDENLDYIEVHRSALNFTVRALPQEQATLHRLVAGAKVVVIPLVPWYTQVPEVCKALRLPCVIDADYTLAIREEIARAETRNPLRRWRRLLYVRRLEPHYRAMFRSALGAHLLGRFAFEAYAPLSRSPLLYYDTRMRRAMLVTANQADARASRLRSGAPLRLIYSGRWIPIKGVLDLPRVASALRRLGCQFEMEIFGTGSLEPQLRQTLAVSDLAQVHLRGTLPFAELMRHVTGEADLFVCCHRQGDPSTTFVEMLSAGIPLVGYDRAGLRGILQEANAGWLTPQDEPEALAARIVELDRDRDALITAADAAAKFSSGFGFEDMVRRRIAHLEAVAARFESDRSPS